MVIWAGKRASVQPLILVKSLSVSTLNRKLILVVSLVIIVYTILKLLELKWKNKN